jgi:hypothetical protein
MKKFSEIKTIKESIEVSDTPKLESSIESIISDSIEIRGVPYGDWCSECNRGEEQVTSDSIQRAAKEIIEFLKKEGLI